MSEGYQIFIAGVLLAIIQFLVGILIGWLAYEIRMLRHDVGHRVHFAECDRRMEDQNRRISLLEGIRCKMKIFIFAALILLFVSGCAGSKTIYYSKNLLTGDTTITLPEGKSFDIYVH